MRRTLNLFLAAAVLAISSGAAFAQEFKLTVRELRAGRRRDRPRDRNSSRKQSSRHTNGRVDIAIYGNNSLGSNREALEMARAGGIDFVVAGSTRPAASRRFCTRSRCLTCSRIATPCWHCSMERLAKHQQARREERIADYWPWVRHVSNSKRPILKVEDMRGLKLRTLPSPVHVSFFRALGAESTPMDWAEVMPALQQGVIDGQRTRRPHVSVPRLNFKILLAHSAHERSDVGGHESGRSSKDAEGYSGRPHAGGEGGDGVSAANSRRRSTTRRS